jgi:hypothetical protein
MSFYSNAATRAKEAREARERQMQSELERRERIRMNLSYSLKDARAQEARDIQQAREEYQKQFQEYYKAMRDSVLSTPDPDGFFNPGPALDTDPGVERDIHWNLFLKDHPDFYNSDNNKNTLSQYFTVNQCYRYDRWVLSAAYKRLLSLGLLETEETVAQSQTQPAVMIHEPEPAPRKTYYRIADNDWDNPGGKPDDEIEGTNPETGEKWILTRWQVERLDANSFKRFARLSKADRTLAGYLSNYGNRYTQ